MASAQLHREHPKRDAYVGERGIRLTGDPAVFGRRCGEALGGQGVRHDMHVGAVVGRAPEAPVQQDHQRSVVTAELDVGDVLRARPPRHDHVGLRRRPPQYRIVFPHTPMLPYSTCTEIDITTRIHDPQTEGEPPRLAPNSGLRQSLSGAACYGSAPT